MECLDESAEDDEMQEMDDQEPPRLKRTQYPRMDSEMVFRPQPALFRRSQEPVIMIENGLEPDDDNENDDHFYPPCTKRLRFDDNCLIAEAILAYAANVKKTSDASIKY